MIRWLLILAAIALGWMFYKKSYAK